MTTAVHARDANGVLVCFRATVGEEEGVDVTRSDLRKFDAETRAHFGGHKRVRVRQDCCLLLDSTNHALVAMANVHAHELAVEIDVALAFGRPKINAFGAG